MRPLHLDLALGATIIAVSALVADPQGWARTAVLAVLAAFAVATWTASWRHHQPTDRPVAFSLRHTDLPPTHHS